MSPEPEDAVFVAVAHELRSPLTSIKGFTALLLQRWTRFDDAQRREMIERVHHDAERVERLIADLLDHQRLARGEVPLRLGPVALPALARAVVERVALTAPDLELEVSFPEACPVVEADGDRVEQVLLNLVENGVRHGRPSIVRITGAVQAEQVVVTVTDDGRGIPPDDLPHIFDEHFRGGDREGGGLGLGLWISRQLAQAHGGTLTATSEPGEGTALRLTLPRQPIGETPG